MNHATLAKSERLSRVLAMLRRRGGRGATTREIIAEAQVCAVNSIVAEIRANGVDVLCEYEGTTEDGSRVYRYVIPGLPIPLFEEAA